MGSDADVSRMDQASGGVLITLPPTQANAGLLRGLQVGSMVYIEEGKKQLRVTERLSGLKVLPVHLFYRQCCPTLALSTVL